MQNEYLRIGAIPHDCPDCGTELRSSIENVDIIRTQSNDIPYRFRCSDCFETIEQACPDCGHREFDADGTLECLGCGKILR